MSEQLTKEERDSHIVTAVAMIQEAEDGLEHMKDLAKSISDIDTSGEAELTLDLLVHGADGDSGFYIDKDSVIGPAFAAYIQSRKEDIDKFLKEYFERMLLRGSQIITDLKATTTEVAAASRFIPTSFDDELETDEIIEDREESLRRLQARSEEIKSGNK